MVVDPFYTGKTHFIMEKRRNIFWRDIFIITRSPEKINDGFTTEENTRKIGAFVGGIIDFDDM